MGPFLFPLFKTDKRLRSLYDKYNRLLFDGTLPDNVVLGWDDKLTGKHLGQTLSIEEDGNKYFIISISTEIKKLPLVIHQTLVHEMSHVRLYPFMKHGKGRWKDEVIRVIVKGAWDLW